MNSVAGWRLGHRPALDGVRGIAILIVLIGHSMPQAVSYPAAGVALFFVLSGFLITSLLIEEYQERGKINIFAFYGRRARRLLPAFVVVALVTAVSMVAIGQARAGLFDAVVAASYVGNWVMATGQWLGPLSHTWSLAIEEQFYALWPLIFLLIVPRLRARRLAILLGLLAVTVMVVRAWSATAGATSDVLAFATNMQADGLLIGCALAVLVHHRRVSVPKITGPLALGALMGAAFVLPVAIVPLLAGVTSYSVMLVVDGTISVLASGVLVIAVVTRERPDPLLENRWLVRLGLISYGLYLWHYPVLWHLGFFNSDQAAYPGLVAVVVGVGLSVLAAVASYRWVEGPFRKRRSDRSPAPTYAAGGPAVVPAPAEA